MEVELRGAGSAEGAWARGARALLHSNRAAARMSRQEWVGALADCHVAVGLRPRWAKGLRRRAECLVQLGCHAQAAADFVAAGEGQCYSPYLP